MNKNLIAWFALWATMQAENAGFSKAPTFFVTEDAISASIGRTALKADIEGISAPGVNGKVAYADIP